MTESRLFQEKKVSAHDARNRCPWAGPVDGVYRDYHDAEWGVPVHDDRLLFEFLILEGFQAGLSWSLILKKRPYFRTAFDGFDARRIARFTEKKVHELLLDGRIVRNRSKILAAVKNARAFLEVQETYSGFDPYIWQFVDGKPVVHHIKTQSEMPCSSAESDAMSRDLKQKGFSFAGTTICYSFMQATGMVNDHLVDCFRYREILYMQHTIF